MCYRSRRVRVRRPFGEWERERPPSAQQETATLDRRVPKLELQLLFRRWSQTVQLPLIQAFPVLKVVVQVLHKIGKVCKSWGDNKRQWSSNNTDGLSTYTFSTTNLSSRYFKILLDLAISGKKLFRFYRLNIDLILPILHIPLPVQTKTYASMFSLLQVASYCEFLPSHASNMSVMK